jgi:hypothetical protein
MPSAEDYLHTATAELRELPFSAFTDGSTEGG